jgi:hypothetical protein
MRSTLVRLVGSAALMLSLGVARGGSATFLPAGPATFRWLDIGDYAYGLTFRSAYDYSQANVGLTYSSSDSSFTGTLVGSGLKPNFAYQLKFEGKPATLGGTTQENWTNERLGYAGRWWMDRYLRSTGAYYDGKNCNDSDYTYWKARSFLDTTYRYVIKGYLMFDYVVTTGDGEIPGGTTGWSFIVDSSFHVLFKMTQGGWDANDSTPTTHLIDTFASAYYDAPAPLATTVSLYGEWEPGRALPGELLLPLGTYKARLVLTEESFHSTNSLGGAWAGALATDVSFAIVAPGTLTGTVKTNSGKAISGAKVAVSQNGAPVASTSTNSTGKYTLPGLMPATYSVTASATGYQSKSASATITSGATKTLDFKLSK